MHKRVVPFLGSLLAAGAAFAEDPAFTLDVTAATTAATAVKTGLSNFLTGPVAQLVLVVSGAALSVYLISLLFKWARKAGK